ncbi:hypothetical protein D3C86_1968280 [compost metagenome]
MVSWSAEANTSTGAPCWICASSGPEAAKLKLSFAPGWLFSNAWPTVWKALVRLAAAETTSSCACTATEPRENAANRVALSSQRGEEVIANP